MIWSGIEKTKIKLSVFQDDEDIDEDKEKCQGT